MNDFELFDSLTDIDDAFILEAHEVPASRWSYSRFGGLRRAAVLIAAVMVLAVTVMATGGDLPIAPGIVWGEMYSMVSIDWTGGDTRVFQEDSGAIEVDGTEYGYHLYTTHGSMRAVASMDLDSGENLEVVFEAYLLMPDGTREYKILSKQGTGHVAVFMTNQIDGKFGSILTIRASFYRLTQTGERLLVRSWTNSLEQRSDGIITSDGASYWTEEPAEAQAVLPEGSDAVVVITEPDEG